MPITHFFYAVLLSLNVSDEIEQKQRNISIPLLSIDQFMMMTSAQTNSGETGLSS